MRLRWHLLLVRYLLHSWCNTTTCRTHYRISHLSTPRCPANCISIRLCFLVKLLHHLLSWHCLRLKCWHRPCRLIRCLLHCRCRILCRHRSLHRSSLVYRNSCIYLHGIITFPYISKLQTISRICQSSPNRCGFCHFKKFISKLCICCTKFLRKGIGNIIILLITLIQINPGFYNCHIFCKMNNPADNLACRIYQTEPQLPIFHIQIPLFLLPFIRNNSGKFQRIKSFHFIQFFYCF